MIEPFRLVLVGGFTVALVGVVAALVVKPPTRLSSRVRPYVPGARAALGSAPVVPAGAETAVLLPLVRALGRALSAIVDAASDDELALRLDRAGAFRGLDPSERVSAYRLRQLKAFSVGVGVGVALGWALGWRGTGLAAAGALGAVVGSTRDRGRIDKAIEARRELMRAEVYTVDQLLALRVRAGGGVLQSVGEITMRGRGAVVEELGGALAAVRAGSRPRDAFARLASTTAEPHCARTYAALAAAEERGSDLAVVLFALADDVRRDRRETLRRRAVRRRAAMLVPIIALLAPVMLLFITAPLPRIVLGGF